MQLAGSVLEHGRTVRHLRRSGGWSRIVPAQGAGENRARARDQDEVLPVDTTLVAPGSRQPGTVTADCGAPVAAPAARPDPAAPCVFLLLSTFNGSAFLNEQLDSLLSQTHENWVLFWRDDGSTDQTKDILARFAANTGPDRCIQMSGPRRRMQPAASYFALLRAVLPRMRRSDMLAFVDQDDLWLPTKLHRGLTVLAASDPDRALLYCARLRVVDEDLRRLTETRIVLPLPGFPAALTQNIATGCTIMLNRCAADLIARSEPPAATMHDWWCYLAVTAAGGKVLVDNTVVALYRQHGNNAVGIPRSWPRRAVAALRRGPSLFMNVLRQHLDALLARPDLITGPAHETACQLRQALQQDLRHRLAALRTQGLKRQTWSETAIFRLWFLIG